MKPLASVIIPTYNVENFIFKTIQSVVQQTVKPYDFETIIIDDCSVDNTVKIIGNSIKNLSNFAFIAKKNNSGAADTKNNAVSISQGKYIILLDGDDLLEPDAIKQTLDFMEEHPEIHYSYSRHKRIDENGNFICDRPGYSFSRKKLLHFNFVGAVECFTREHFNKLGGFNCSSYVEDYDFILRGSEILEQHQIVQHPFYLYKYRIHGNNKSVTNIKKSREASVIAIQNSLKRKEGIDAEVFWSHLTHDKYNYYDWRIK